jgi:uncharacterized protein (TIGR02145 family)
MRKFFLCAAALFAVSVAGAQGVEGVKINGVVWADRNLDAPMVFAAEPASPGMFYQWNRPMGWGPHATLTPSSPGISWNSLSDKRAGNSFVNDPCPVGWRVPNARELGRLANPRKVFSEWTVRDGVSGRLFMDRKTQNTIFLPAAGGRNLVGALYFKDELGYYWSNRRVTDAHALSLMFGKEGTNPLHEGSLAYGYNIRCVKN